MPIQIHNKTYVTVAERIQELHGLGLKKIDILTEVLAHQPVVVKAVVITERGTFTGISAANPAKAIEKQSPYEVAETSAVGRALGFMGIGSVESIASADEVRSAPQRSVAEDIEELDRGFEAMFGPIEDITDKPTSFHKCAAKTATGPCHFPKDQRKVNPDGEVWFSCTNWRNHIK